MEILDVNQLLNNALKNVVPFKEIALQKQTLIVTTFITHIEENH